MPYRRRKRTRDGPRDWLATLGLREPRGEQSPPAEAEPAARGVPPDSARLWLRRAVLYGASGLLVWTGVNLYARLRGSAAAADADYEPVTVFEGPLEAEALKDTLEESGSPEAEVRALMETLRRAGAANKERRGDEFRLVRSTAGAIQHLTVTRGQRRFVIVPEGKAFATSRQELPLRDITRAARGTMRGSLWASMAGSGVPPEIIQEYADVFQWTVDFLTEPRDGDDYAVSWTERRTPDERVWGREIRAALYDGKVSGRQVGVLYGDRYYDEKGLSLERMFLRAPLNYRRISSYFSRGRFHPILRRSRPHHGTDYAAPRGTPVVAVGAGMVSAAGRHGGFGNRVEIRHTPVYTTLYGHLDRYAKGLRPGMHVRQGQVIGYVGSTGLASGPHLHFQISQHGKWVDFMRLKLPLAREIPAGQKTKFAAERDRRLAALAAPKAAPKAASAK